MYQVYIINENDDLNDISKKFGVSIDELIRINGKTIDLIPGNMIVVPSINDDLYYTYIVKEGDNLYDIARTYNQDLDVLYSINGIKKGDYIYPNQQILIPKNDVVVYLTKNDDTLKSVADNIGVTAVDLYNLNNNLFLLSDQLVVYKRV